MTFANRFFVLTAFIFVAVFSIDANAQTTWQLVYANDASGNPLHSLSLSNLENAIVSGADVKTITQLHTDNDDIGPFTYDVSVYSVLEAICADVKINPLGTDVACRTMTKDMGGTIESQVVRTDGSVSWANIYAGSPAAVENNGAGNINLVKETDWFVRY